MMRLTTSALALLLGGCVAANSSGNTLVRTLNQTSIVDMLGARGIARELAFHCDEVDLAAGLDQQVDILRVTRADEFEAVQSGPVSRAAAIQSAAFEEKYDISIDLLRTARKDWDNSMCQGALAEARTGSLIGLMLERSRG